MPFGHDISLRDKKGKTMDYAYSILMFCFGGAILFYALDIYIFKSVKLIPRRYRHFTFKDEKEYMTQFAKILAIVALAPILSGVVGLFNVMVGGVVLIVGFVVTLVLATKLIKKVM